MDGLLDINGVKNMARFISVCFLLVHIAMIIIFWRCGVTPMIYFNIGSILFYVLSFVLIQKELLWLYTDLVYIEVVANMTCAVSLMLRLSLGAVVFVVTTMVLYAFVREATKSERALRSLRNELAEHSGTLVRIDMKEREVT